ncbi:MAG: hypothetical protein WD068_01345 [Candidatus Babeliales bacterium]
MKKLGRVVLGMLLLPLLMHGMDVSHNEHKKTNSESFSNNFSKKTLGHTRGKRAYSDASVLLSLNDLVPRQSLEIECIDVWHENEEAVIDVVTGVVTQLS